MGGEATFRVGRPFILLELHSDELLSRFGKQRRDVVAPLFAAGYCAALIKDHNRLCTGVVKVEAGSPQFDRQATEMFLFY